MKAIISIFALLLLCLSGCEETKPAPQVHQEAPLPPPPPAPTPVVTNPFAKPPPPPPVPVHEPVQTPHWEQVGGEFKMNDSWSFWTWRDSANHNTCYLYNIITNGTLIGHGMSCVKE